MKKRMRQLAVGRLRRWLRRDDDRLVRQCLCAWTSRAYQYRLCQQPQSSLEVQLAAQVTGTETDLLMLEGVCVVP